MHRTGCPGALPFFGELIWDFRKMQDKMALNKLLDVGQLS